MAVPVLVDRRAGWHPVVVIAVCAFLRWPYHAYHGVLNTLPWAVIWGGAYAAVYLYLRRLTPIIVVHILVDLPIILGDVTAWADVLTYSIATRIDRGPHRPGSHRSAPAGTGHEPTHPGQ